MNHSSFKKLTLVAIAAIALVPTMAMAQVYKCGTAGHVAYQDSPCKDDPKATPYIAVASSSAGASNAPSAFVAASSPAAGSGDDLDSIYVQAELAKGEQQKLQMQSSKEIAALRGRMKGTSPDVAKQAEQMLTQNWAKRLETANLREAQLVAKLHRLCPGGFDLNSRDQTCLPAATAEGSNDSESSYQSRQPTPPEQPTESEQPAQPEQSPESSN